MSQLSGFSKLLFEIVTLVPLESIPELYIFVR